MVLTELCLLATLLSVVAGSELDKEPLKTILPEFVGHPALDRLNVFACGTVRRLAARGYLDPCHGLPRPEEHPWLVAIGFQRRQNPGSVTYSCSGVLLNSDIVLTSGNCAQGSASHRPTKVRLGDYDLAHAMDCDPMEGCVNLPLDRDVAATLIHPNFSAIYDNVGLVRLSAPVDFGATRFTVVSICLPLYTDDVHPLKTQYALSFSLNKRRGPLVSSNASCCDCTADRDNVNYRLDYLKVQDYGQITGSFDPCRYTLRNKTRGICIGTGYPCIADYGAPLVATDRYENQFHVMGVASTVPSPRSCHSSRVRYASVAPHVGWILDGIEELMN